MTQYLISFPDGSMVISPEDLPEVTRASLAVVDEAIAAGVWIHGAGIAHHDVTVVGTDGSVTDTELPLPLGGFSLIDVPTRDDALAWARKFAVACRCPQEVRELMGDAG